MIWRLLLPTSGLTHECDIALIAGEGVLPLLAAQNMQKQGLRCLILDLQPHGSNELKALATSYHPIHAIQIAKAARLMKRSKVKEIVMLGRVPHQLLLELRPWQLSFSFLRLWIQLPDTRADTILSALVDYFNQRGFPVISSVKYLQQYLLRATKAPFSDHLRADILLGIAVAKTLGSVDVGQSVIVKKGTIIAVEALEGTDHCIDRAIKLGSNGAILVKMAKPEQDDRFDVPTIGQATFERLIQGKFSALVVEDSKTLCSELETLQKLKEAGLELIVADKELIREALARYKPKFGDLLD